MLVSCFIIQCFLTPPPPTSSFQYVNVGKQGAQVYLFEAVFPDGPLRIDDTLVIEGVQPDCCPPDLDGKPNATLWSASLFSQNKSPLIHMAVKRSWQLISLASTTGAWGTWTKAAYYPCPFAPKAQFKMEISIRSNHVTVGTHILST